MTSSKTTKKKSKNAGVGSNGDDDPTMSITFRMPTSLKECVEETAQERGMTTTRLVIEALMNEVNDKPPRWWSNLELSRYRELPKARKGLNR